MAGTLGERLRAQEDARTLAAAAAASARTRADVEKAQRERQEVEGYFQTARRTIEQAVDAGRTVPRITLGKDGDDSFDVAQILKTFNWNDPARRIDRPAHPYYDVWKAFANWAVLEQLLVAWRYDHDGMGMHSWHVLTVEPL